MTGPASCTREYKSHVHSGSKSQSFVQSIDWSPWPYRREKTEIPLIIKLHGSVLTCYAGFINIINYHFVFHVPLAYFQRVMKFRRSVELKGFPITRGNWSIIKIFRRWACLLFSSLHFLWLNGSVLRRKKFLRNLYYFKYLVLFKALFFIVAWDSENAPSGRVRRNCNTGGWNILSCLSNAWTFTTMASTVSQLL